MHIEQILRLFNLRPLEQEAFRICFESGATGATALAQKAGVSRTSIYDILDSLVKNGLIVESQKNGVKFFSAQKPEMIEILIEEKQKELAAAGNAVLELKKEFYAKRINAKPRMQIFEGQESLRQMMKDMLLYRDVTAYVFWPVEKVIELLGSDFYREFHKRRAERNIQIKVIWPQSQAGAKKMHDFLRNDLELKREIRVAPKNIDFSFGYAIYADTVRFISSQKENYGFLIESREMAEMMRRQFEIIWGISRKI